MFGKLGRNGGPGRGSGKRALSTPTQLHRPGEAGGARPPIGASGPARSRPGAPITAVSVPGREEKFSLEPGVLEFGAIIRLTPDIVKEIKRLEAQGGAAKIKFDENANSTDGNVIEVSGKEFRFTWSQELTDLCDIYEERQNGDDGDGLLVECGAAWRKLNVQRILDESTKNHVKMRSEEAERMLKSRKAIVLDPTNPSVKNQAKSMAAAAVDGNVRRIGWKHKKEMLSKKRKVENNQGATALAQHKSVSKSATASNSNFIGISSPVPSPLQSQPHAQYSSLRTGNSPRGDTNPGAVTPLLHINRDEFSSREKELTTEVSGDSMQEISGFVEDNIDLQSTLINLLSQNPKGMSLKELELAVGEMVPNSLTKMESVLKNIAKLQTPGMYFLKQQRQVESSTRNCDGGRCAESGGNNVTRTDQVMGAENEGCRLKKTTSTNTPKDDNRHDILNGRKNVKESKSDKLNGWKRSAEQATDGFTTFNGSNNKKSMEFTSDEENTPYMKYKKADINLRGSIKDYSMCAESSGKNVTIIDQVIGAKNEGRGPKKIASTSAPKDDNRHNFVNGRKKVQESDSDKLNGWNSFAEQGTDGFTNSNGTNSRKSMEFSSDEENIPYMKYKKADIDLKGPIKDYSMYKDYAREYQEKYSHYCSLYKNLEKIRNDFLRVGDDLELARGRDMEEYYDIVKKLRQMYCQHGEKNKEMKRIFILLHEELKTLKQRIADFAAVHAGE